MKTDSQFPNTITSQNHEFLLETSSEEFFYIRWQVQVNYVIKQVYLLKLRWWSHRIIDDINIIRKAPAIAILIADRLFFSRLADSMMS